MDSSPLVSTAWLEAHLGDPDLRVIEVSNVRDDKLYHEGHVPGAQWVYWKSACWHETDREFVTPAAMARMFGGMGIGPQSTVVLCGDPVQFGSYAFWALIGFLAIINIGNIIGPPPPDEMSLSIVALAQWIFIPWGYWIDRHRERLKGRTRWQS